jgi:hypothetical protein
VSLNEQECEAIVAVLRGAEARLLRELAAVRESLGRFGQTGADQAVPPAPVKRPRAKRAGDPPISVESFIRVWNEHGSSREVAAYFNKSIRWVRHRAERYRSRGLRLKAYGTGGRPRSGFVELAKVVAR